MALTKRNFFQFLLTLTSVIVVVYLILHLIFSGNGCVQRNLTKEDITFLTDADTVKRDEVVFYYLDRKYEFIDRNYAAHQLSLIKRLGKANYVKIISASGITTKSVFWLCGDAVIFELIFWSWFGTLCSFLYYYSENRKKNSIRENEFTTYVAKIFYAPFVTIIIFYVPGVFSSSNTFLSGGGHWILVFAFILGFFSGRAVELLDKIKNLIFPYENSNTEVGQAPAASAEAEKSVGLNVVPTEILTEAINRKAEEWEHVYGPLESISTGFKKVEGQATNVYCIHFDVTTKPSVAQVPGTQLIPDVISYLALNGKIYQLPTDVNEVGATTPDAYDPNQPQSTGKDWDPKCLGLSCSRVSSNATGTIGLKVAKRAAPNTPLLLSCYHVFCAPELQSGISQVNSVTDTVASPVVISPSLKDGNNDPNDGTIPLGEVIEGFLGDDTDIGLARLDAAFINQIYRELPFPKPMGITTILKEHEASAYPLRMVGRTSGMQDGYVISHYSRVTLDYGGGKRVTFNGIIKSSKLSEKGDSGAAVYDAQRNVVGIVFASNVGNTYILPISLILSQFKLTLV